MLRVAALSAALPVVVFGQEASADRAFLAVEAAVFVVFLIKGYVRVTSHEKILTLFLAFKPVD